MSYRFGILLRHICLRCIQDKSHLSTANNNKRQTEAQPGEVSQGGLRDYDRVVTFYILMIMKLSLWHAMVLVSVIM